MGQYLEPVGQRYASPMFPLQYFILFLNHRDAAGSWWAGLGEKKSWSDSALSRQLWAADVHWEVQPVTMLFVEWLTALQILRVDIWPKDVSLAPGHQTFSATLLHSSHDLPTRFPRESLSSYCWSNFSGNIRQYFSSWTDCNAMVMWLAEAQCTT